MKIILPILFLFVNTFCLAQIPERRILKGKINVPIEVQASNINVYNKNSKEGTSTNPYGEFLIKAKIGDHLFLTSVQFHNFEIEITKEIMQEKDIVINVTQNVNQLNEVIVSSNVLSGNLSVDVKKIDTEKTVLKIDNQELISGYDADITTGSQISSYNATMDDEYLDYGMNFVKIFKRYIQKKPKDKQKNQIEDIDVEIRKMFDNQFFKEYFDIKSDNINEFIFYAETHGLDAELLKKKNEIDLIQFLLNISREFNSYKEEGD